MIVLIVVFLLSVCLFRSVAIGLVYQRRLMGASLSHGRLGWVQRAGLRVGLVNS